MLRSLVAFSVRFPALVLLAALAGQVLAGVQYVRAEGPPGTLPARLRVSG